MTWSVWLTFHRLKKQCGLSVGGSGSKNNSPKNITCNRIRRPVRINYILWDFVFRPGRDINFSCLVLWKEVVQLVLDIQRTPKCFQRFRKTKKDRNVTQQKSLNTQREMDEEMWRKRRRWWMVLFFSVRRRTVSSSGSQRAREHRWAPVMCLRDSQ